MRILIADDDRQVAMTLAEMVRACDHEVIGVVPSGLEAIHAFKIKKPDLVLMDFMMGRLNGLTALRNILSMDAAARVVFISGVDSDDMSASSSGAVGVLRKPVALEQMRELLRKLDSKPGDEQPA